MLRQSGKHQTQSYKNQATENFLCCAHKGPLLPLRRRAVRKTVRLEVENDAASEEEIVLRLAEETVAQIIRIQPERQPWVPTEIRSAARLYCECILAACRCLWHLMASTKQHVGPRLPTALPPGDFWSAHKIQQLDVLVSINRRGERSGDIAFNPKPVVGEISHG